MRTTNLQLVPTFRFGPPLLEILIVKHSQVGCAPLIRAISTSRIARQTKAEARYRATTATVSRVEMNSIDENTNVPNIKLIYARKTAAKFRQTDIIPSPLSSNSSPTGFANGISHVFQSIVFFRTILALSRTSGVIDCLW